MAYKNKESSQLWWQQNKERLKDQRREYARQRRQSNKDYLDTYKLERGCSVCGYNRCPQALEFHHPDPTVKEGSLANMSREGRSVDRINTEIEKCIVICANCHREHHAGFMDDDSPRTKKNP